MEEIWSILNGICDNYAVSQSGKIMSNGFEYVASDGKMCRAFPRKLKTSINKKTRYETVVLRINKKPKSFSVHRLVAKYFIDNPLNLPEVNHKDGNKLNNEKTNLEWVTKSQNHIHRFEILKQIGNQTGCFNGYGSKKVTQYSIDGELLNIYASMNEASRLTGINRSSLKDATNGRNKTAGGYIWRTN